MKTHLVIVDFARKYGIKEGLILTELCRRMQVSVTAAMPFSVSIGKKHFPYLSEKQIRLSLAHLWQQAVSGGRMSRKDRWTGLHCSK
jgi:hypothetical protein